MKLFLIFLCLYLLLIIAWFLPVYISADTVPVISTIQVNEFNKIALCESRNNPHAKNPTSSASGRFQFINKSWYHYGKQLWGEDFYEKNIWDYDDNTELAWYVYTKYGTSDWNESKKCWDML